MSGIIPPEVAEVLPPEVVGFIVALIAAYTAYKGGRKKEAHKQFAELESNIREYLKEEGIFPSPDVVQTDKDRVNDILKAEIDNYDGSAVPVKTIFTDGNYYLPTEKEQMDEAKMFNPFEYLPYRPSRFDCENFAAAFKVFSAFLWGTNGVGMVIDWSGGHAYNVIVYSTGEIEFYEPQEGELVEIGQGEKYQMENATIMF